MATKVVISSSQTARRGGRLLGLVVLSAVMAAVIVGCSRAPEVTIDDPVLDQGRELYVRNCAGCHGISGGGATGPKLAGGAAAATYPNIEDQTAIVTDGKDKMPGFGAKLSDEEIEAIVRYTREVL